MSLVSGTCSAAEATSDTSSLGGSIPLMHGWIIFLLVVGVPFVISWVAYDHHHSDDRPSRGTINGIAQLPDENDDPMAGWGS